MTRKTASFVMTLVFFFSLTAAGGILVGGVKQCHASPTDGQQVTYRYDSTHEYKGVITLSLNSTEANLVVFSNGSTWFNSVSASVPAQLLTYVTEGASDNRWRDATPAEAPDSISVITGMSSGSMTLNGAAVQLSTTGDTFVSVTVKIDLTLTLLAGQSGTVHLFCDAAGTPTTEVDTAALAHGLGVATTASLTYTLKWWAPKNHFCKLTTTNDVGSPSFTLLRQAVQFIGPS